jgi:hypothetical protein
MSRSVKRAMWWAALLLILAGLIALVSFRVASRPPKASGYCPSQAGQIRGLWQVVYRYAIRREGLLPPSLQMLQEELGLPVEMLHCPGNPVEPIAGACDYDSLFERAGFWLSVLGFERPSQVPLLWCKRLNHREGTGPLYRNVVFVDGSARNISDEEFADIMKEADRNLRETRMFHLEDSEPHGDVSVP